jgi:hypothetical protein
MYATHSHRRRRERGVHAHAHGGVARKRALLTSPRMVIFFIAAFVLLANARHALFPKVLISESDFHLRSP